MHFYCSRHCGLLLVPRAYLSARKSLKTSCCHVRLHLRIACSSCVWNPRSYDCCPEKTRLAQARHRRGAPSGHHGSGKANESINLRSPRGHAKTYKTEQSGGGTSAGHASVLDWVTYAAGCRGLIQVQGSYSTLCRAHPHARPGYCMTFTLPRRCVRAAREGRSAAQRSRNDRKIYSSKMDEAWNEKKTNLKGRREQHDHRRQTAPRLPAHHHCYPEKECAVGVCLGVGCVCCGVADLGLREMVVCSAPSHKRRRAGERDLL